MLLTDTVAEHVEYTNEASNQAPLHWSMYIGGATHVLLTDTVAEHIAGCNMAFRRQQLQWLGGFNDQFWVAGDDVDICWRIQAQGWTVGFQAAAVVWHRARPDIARYRC